MPKPKLLTVEEAAVVLRYHPESVRRALRLGRIPGRRIGKRWYLELERPAGKVKAR